MDDNMWKRTENFNCTLIDRLKINILVDSILVQNKRKRRNLCYVDFVSKILRIDFAGDFVLDYWSLSRINVLAPVAISLA